MIINNKISNKAGQGKRMVDREANLVRVVKEGFPGELVLGQRPK